MAARDDGVLSSPTPEEVVAQQDRRQQGERAEANRRRDEESRARADAEVDEFQLAGSDRAADANPAQRDLNESDQDRSNREWRENYARVSGAEDLNAVSARDIERAIHYASMQVARLGPGKAWEGDEQAKKLIEAYSREIGNLEFNLKLRKEAAASPAPAQNTSAPAPQRSETRRQQAAGLIELRKRRSVLESLIKCLG